MPPWDGRGPGRLAPIPDPSDKVHKESRWTGPAQPQQVDRTRGPVAVSSDREPPRCLARLDWALGHPWLLSLVVAGLVWLLYFRAQPHLLTFPDAQDYAQVGRQLVWGRGPTTNFMPWNGLEFLHALGAESSDWPNITRFPLIPGLMAAAFTLLGPSDEAAHLPGALAYLLTAVGAGLLGARVYGGWSGLVAGLAVACLPVLVRYSLSGLTETLLGALLLLIAACVVHVGSPRGTGSRPWPILAAGVLMGLAILDRYDAAILDLPILALWLIPRPAGLRRAGLFLLAQALVIMPWSVFLFAKTGNPLFNIQSGSIPGLVIDPAGGLGWYQPLYTSPWEVIQRDPARAVLVSLRELAQTPDALGTLVVWPLLLAGAVACVLDLARPAGGLGRFLLASLLLKTLAQALLGQVFGRYFLPFVPLLMVVVAGRLDVALRSFPLDWLPIGGVSTLRTFGRGALGMIVVLPSLWRIGPSLVPPHSPPQPPMPAWVEVRPENLARLALLVGPHQLVATNIPWSVAWQADRRAVPLPPAPGRTSELEHRYGLSIDAVYLANQVDLDDVPASWAEWDDLRSRGGPLSGFELTETFPNGARLYLRSLASNR